MDIQQTAFVLHSRPYKETSAIVTFFTEEHGKVNGVVRGVRGGRKNTSQKAAAIQPFQKLQISWREKSQMPQDLVSIRQFEALPVSFPLQSDANICGLYLNEILYRLLFPRVAVESLFADYQQALIHLLSATQDRAKQAWTLRLFEANLLAELGQPLLWDMDAQGEEIDSEANYQYFVQHGPVKVMHEQASHSQPAPQISGHCLQALANQEYCEDCLPALKKLFRTLLADVLGNKPIKTRELFR